MYVILSFESVAQFNQMDLISLMMDSMWRPSLTKKMQIGSQKFLLTCQVIGGH